MTTIDHTRTDENPADNWAIAVARSLNEQRARVRSFVQRQRERFAERQDSLAVQAGALALEGPLGGSRSNTDLTAILDKLVSEVEQLRVEMGHPAGPARTGARQSEGEAVSNGSAPPYDDLRRRFEMAVEDLREVKARNAELEAQLQRRGPVRGAPGAAKTGASDAGGGLDWESQKKRLMAQLKEFDDQDEEENQERLTIDGAIRITDQVVAEKELEIAELKAQLETSADRRSSRHVSQDLLDGDADIQAERERLKKLQEDWTNKLRKAEIEISVERAKLARERSKMQEQINAYEAQLAEHARQAPAPVSPDTVKKAGGRKWLSRLGLSDND